MRLIFKMKKSNIFFSFIIIFLVSCLGSCQKAPINGYLDGKWQLLEIDRDGVVENVKDNQRYYNFSLHVCSLSYYGGVLTEGNLRFDGETIWMEFPYINENAIQRLAPYGIYSNPVEFQVLFLNKQSMILQDGNLILTFRKF